MRPIDQFEFHHRIEDTAGTALVMFSAPACGACRYLERTLDTLGARRPDLALFKVDAQRDAALVREFEVFHLPTLFLFSNGRFHCELRAEPTPQALSTAIERALVSPAQEAP